MKIIENYLYKEKKHFYLFNTINLILVRNFMKFESVEISKKNEKILQSQSNNKTQCKIERSDNSFYCATALYREPERERNRERRNHGISNRAKAMVTERETTQRHPKYLKIV